MVVFGRGKFNLKSLLPAMVAGGISSLINIVKTESYWRANPSTVGYNDVLRDTPLHFTTMGLVTPFFGEWIVYLAVVSFIISRALKGRVTFFGALLVSVISFASVVLIWDFILSVLHGLNQATLRA